MKKLPEQVDFIVVGAGVAGLRAAITLAEAGKVLVLAKQELTEANTQYAQGGIAVALSDEDEISLHLQDTIQAGDGVVNAQAAHVLVEEGPQRIQELIIGARSLTGMEPSWNLRAKQRTAAAACCMRMVIQRDGRSDARCMRAPQR